MHTNQPKKKAKKKEKTIIKRIIQKGLLTRDCGGGDDDGGMLPVACSELPVNREPYSSSTVNHLCKCNMDAAAYDWSDLFAFFMFECEAIDKADA
jgi:hypothetical protein